MAISRRALAPGSTASQDAREPDANAWRLMNVWNPDMGAGRGPSIFLNKFNVPFNPLVEIDSLFRSTDIETRKHNAQ